MDETTFPETLTPEQAEAHLRSLGVRILSDREAADLITPTDDEAQ